MSSDPRNWILQKLPVADRQRIVSSLEPIQLEHRQILYDLNKPIEHVYFIETALGSILSFLADGTAIETATVGCDGIVGLPVFFGADTQAEQAFVQVSGEAYRMPAAQFREEVERTPELRLAVGRFAQATFTLVAQNSACNRRHSMEQRCARWLLLTADRVGRDTFDLTQDFISQMLGVRRASVNEVAGTFQRSGLIEYSRGHIRVKDRAGLEQMACECYAIIKNELARLVGGAAASTDPLRHLQMSENGHSTAGEGA